MKYNKSFNGWFGETAKDVQYESLSAFTDTLSNYYKKNSSAGQKLVIAYDPRFLAKDFAEHMACIMAKKGVKVFLSNRPAPSSVSIVAALHKKSLGTVVITGDEYHAKYIGVRAYDMQGYPLGENDISSYESESNTTTKQPSSLQEYMKKGVVELFDTSIVYELFVHKHISFEQMTPTINPLLFNPYYGSGMYYFDYLLMNQKLINGLTIHSERLSDFSSYEPNPSKQYLETLHMMQQEQMDLGFVVSPDCTSFEFLVGEERLAKSDILYFLIQLLATKEKPLSVLVAEENELDIERLTTFPVVISRCSANTFHDVLKAGSFDISMDVYERFYFQHHGAPDALLCGFYLFLFFNDRQKVKEKASVYLNHSRND